MPALLEEFSQVASRQVQAIQQAMVDAMPARSELSERTATFEPRARPPQSRSSGLCLKPATAMPLTCFSPLVVFWLAPWTTRD